MVNGRMAFGLSTHVCEATWSLTVERSFFKCMSTLSAYDAALYTHGELELRFIY